MEAKTVTSAAAEQVITPDTNYDDLSRATVAGDGYYKSASWGSPSKTSCTFGVSNGKLTGLPTLNGGTLIAVVGL